MMRVAFKMLMQDTAKYLGLILGIVFATVLIAQQAGMAWSVILMSVNATTSKTEVDIWVMKPNVEFVDTPESMAEVCLSRVLSVQGVQWAVPYYTGAGMLRSVDGLFKSVSINGVDDYTLTGAPSKDQMVMGNVQDLAQPDSVLVDYIGYRKLYPKAEPKLGGEFEIGQRRCTIVGIYKSKASFSGLPMIVTRRSVAVALARETLNSMTFILVKAKPGIDHRELADRISSETQLRALSRDNFVEMNINWMIKNSGIIENFGITVAMGLVVGIVIVGQTFYMFSVENRKQFAALKAIGVSNSVILQMLLAQAIFVAVIGYAIGIGICSALFYIMNLSPDSSLVGLFLPDTVALATAVIVIVMVILSSVVSAWKVLTVDPALVFRG
ncbi:ABC transporter permease [bacterium]|nr:ABC transporter permease [bacterium]